MVAVPAVEAVKVLVHVAVPAVVPAARVQVVNVPVTPETVKLTEPVGLLTVPTEVSVTVAGHVDPCPMNTGLEQVTLVGVERRFTVMVEGGARLLAERVALPLE